MKYIDDTRVLIGENIKSVNGLHQGSAEIEIEFFNKPYKVIIAHMQECCEEVRLEDFELSYKSIVGVK